MSSTLFVSMTGCGQERPRASTVILSMITRLLVHSVFESEADGEAEDEPRYRRWYAESADSRRGAREREVVREGRADQHSHHEAARVRVALAGHDQHTPGAAACKREGEAGKRHAEEVPQLHRMGDGLSLKAGFELSEREVRHEGRDDEGSDALEQMAVPYHDKVAHRAYGAEARALREPADHKPGGE